MPTFHFAKVDGARLRADSRAGNELVVPGWVDDVDVTGVEDREVLARLLSDDAFPAWGSSLSASYSNYRLVRIEMQASSSKYKRVYFNLVYSTDIGGDPSAYIIRDRSYMAQVQTQRIGNQWIQVAYEPYEGASPDESIPADNVTMNIWRPMRQLQVTRLLAGEPDDSIRNAIGTVNNAPWRGLGIGYWLQMEISTDYARYGNYYSLQMGALSLVHQDWSTFGVLRSQMTGKYVVVPNSVLASLTGGDYTYGITYPNGDPTMGVVKVGPYPLADFTAIYGF